MTKNLTSTNRNALGQLLERVVERQAEILLIEYFLELDADRLGQLVGGGPERGLKRMTRAHGPRQQIERLRETAPRTCGCAPFDAASATASAATNPISAATGPTNGACTNEADQKRRTTARAEARDNDGARRVSGRRTVR